MSEIWHDLLVAVGIQKNDTLIEIGAGNSIKIGLALAKIDFEGTIYLVDPIKEILAESEGLYRDLLPRVHIHPIEATLAEAVSILPVYPHCIVSNHPIDDMIMATTQPKTKLRQLFDWTSILHEQTIPISQESWGKLQSDTEQLARLENNIYNEWHTAIKRLKPQYCIISQYSSATLKNNGMDELNTHAKAILEQIRSQYHDSVMLEAELQNILNTYKNFNDYHIGNEVLNAKNWLVIENT